MTDNCGLLRPAGCCGGDAGRRRCAPSRSGIAEPAGPAACSAPGGTARLQPAALIARVEQQLKAHPDDSRGWQLVAAIYLSMGRFDDAVTPTSAQSACLGSSGDLDGSLGEAIVALNDGRLHRMRQRPSSAPASLPPTDPKPQFYRAASLEQQGRITDAIAARHALLDGAPQDAPGQSRGQTVCFATNGWRWRGHGVDVGVALGNRHRRRGRLGPAVRSYMVLGRPNDAQKALTRAKVGLASDQAKTAIVEGAARSGGLTR